MIVRNNEKVVVLKTFLCACRVWSFPSRNKMSALHLPNKLPNKTSIPMGDDKTRIASATTDILICHKWIILSYPPVTNHNVVGPAMSNNRGVHAHRVIYARWREIRRFVLELKASYFFLNSYTWCFLFEKSNLRDQTNSTLNLECKKVRDQFLETGKFPYILGNFDTVELQNMYGKTKVF